MLIFHSGAENKIDLFCDLAKKGFPVKAILLSYLNGAEKFKSKKEELAYLKSKGTIIMLDSGAHAFLFAHFKEKKGEAKGGHQVSQKAIEILKKKQLDDYVKEYIAFVKKHKDLIDIFVELDVQPIVGKEKVEEWRQMFLDNGLKPMLVWHGESKEKVEEWTKKTHFIGLGGTGGASDTDLRKKLNFSKFIKSKNPNVWIHIFAEAGSDILGQAPKTIDSTDSTNWLTASRFGLFWLKQGNRLVQRTHKNSKIQIIQLIKKYQKELEKVGISVEKAISFKDWQESDKVNLYMIEQFSHYPKLKGYDFLSESANSHIKIVPPILENKTDKLGRNVDSFRFNAVKHGLYAKKLRGLLCDNCPINEKCPHFQKGAVCYYEKNWRRLGNTRNRKTLLKIIDDLLKDAWYRWNRARAFQDAEGGFEDKSVLALEKHISQLVEQKDKLLNPANYSPSVFVDNRKVENYFSYEVIEKAIQKQKELLNQPKQIEGEQDEGRNREMGKILEARKHLGDS